MAQWFKPLFLVVFGCVTLWHCVGCELVELGEQAVHEGLHVEDASTSELVQELIGRGFDRFEDLG